MLMETQKTTKHRNIDVLHNQDKVLKESLSLFMGGSLDFLDSNIKDTVTDILSTEITETTTKKSYADNAFKLSSNTGLHNEWEAHVSAEDMMRFAPATLTFRVCTKSPLPLL
jgi:hypothetical protein